MHRGPRMNLLVKSGEPDFFSVVHDRHKRYAVGLPCARKARHIQYNMNPLRPNLRLGMDLEAPCIDIGNVVRQEIGMDLGDVFMRPHATLTVDKRSPAQRTIQKELVDQLCYNIRLDQMDTERFVLIPFVKEVGIVIPYEIRREDVTRVVYDSVVVMPESHQERDRRRQAVRRLNKAWLSDPASLL